MKDKFVSSVTIQPLADYFNIKYDELDEMKKIEVFDEVFTKLVAIFNEHLALEIPV